MQLRVQAADKTVFLYTQIAVGVKVRSHKWHGQWQPPDALHVVMEKSSTGRVYLHAPVSLGAQSSCLSEGTALLFHACEAFIIDSIGDGLQQGLTSADQNAATLAWSRNVIDWVCACQRAAGLAYVTLSTLCLGSFPSSS